MVKTKLTLQYIISLGIISIIIIFINIFSGIFLLYNDNSVSGKEKAVDIYTREFANYIISKNEKIEIDSKGKKSLLEKGLWIQIIDENGREINSYKKPKEVSDKHTPSDIVNSYKYGGSIDKGSEILFGNKKINNKEYTYLIGFPMNKMRKYTLVVDNDSIIDSFKNIFLVILIIDLIAASILGYLFSERLTKPVKRMVYGIGKLAEEERFENFEEKGLYKGVFHQLNILSNKLEKNEIERIEIQKMRKEWIANISHDIKTPLASIKGYSELMDGSYDISKDEMKKYAEIIHQKSKYIEGLVDDLNLTMKLETDGNVITKEKNNIVSLVRETIIEILNDPKYQNANVEMESNKDIIEKNVDAKLIKRAISNLVYNSLIHNEVSVKIKVNIIEDKDLNILIEDNGKGIKKEDINRIFQRYYRGTNTGEAHKGTGLGMAIVKDIIKSHDGDIRIESEENQGVKIYINIP